jgi:hypothetical protein
LLIPNAFKPDNILTKDSQVLQQQRVMRTKATGQ